MKRVYLLAAALILLLGISCSQRAGSDGEAEPYRDPEALYELITSDEPYLLIDVRSAQEVSLGYIPTAVNIPVESIGEHPLDIPKDYLVVIYCQSGVRSARAKRILLDLGYTNVVDFGGINRWPYDTEMPSP